MDGVELENIPSVLDGITVTGGTMLDRKSIPRVSQSLAGLALGVQIAVYTLAYLFIFIVF